MYFLPLHGDEFIAPLPLLRQDSRNVTPEIGHLSSISPDFYLGPHILITVRRLNQDGDLLDK